MISDPLPQQLTVGQLKELLCDVPDATFRRISVVVPPSLHVDPRPTILLVEMGEKSQKI
jgi:hypothetical protein